jgi:hypothetical protein
MQKLRSLVSLPIVSLLLATAAPARDQSIAVHLSSDEDVAFRWASDRCSDSDIPDAPARAFRDSNDAVHLLGTHFDNRSFTVLEGRPKRVDCHSLLDSPDDPDPAQYRDHRWLAATWTDDGHSVHALVHHEYQGQRHAGACAFKDYMRCWYNTITYARSDDGGQTFTQSDPPAVVAAAPFRQDVGQGRPRGFFNPTNIIKRDGFWYALMNTTGWQGQPAGTCVFRTRDITRPELWTAWDGRAFASRFDDPYLASGPKQINPTCKPVAAHSFGSIQRIDGSDLVIAVLIVGSRGGAQRGWQLAYSLSKDMVTWSDPTGFAPVISFGSDDCNDTARFAYPSLLDFNSTSRNFDTIGRNADLFLTRFNIHDCSHSTDRDLVSHTIELWLGEQ